MQINIIMQKENENTIANAISECLAQNAKKAYFFVGNFKETGYKIIEEDLIDIKTKLFFAIGIDKKSTTKAMLDGLLDFTDDVYYYSNNDVNEFVSNMCIFEYTDRVEMYISASNLSESGIQTDLSLYTKVTYDLKDTMDKQQYKAQIKELLKLVENDGFNKLDKEAIRKLVENKEIFSTRQYNHSVMSISELLGKKPKPAEYKEEKNVEEEETKKEVEIPKVDLSDISIDIDIPEEEVSQKKSEEIDIDYEEEKITLPKDIEGYESEEDKPTEEANSEDEDVEYTDEALDINDMLFSKADIKLDISTKKEDKKKATKKATKAVNEEPKEVVKVKKVNLNSVTNFIFEASNKNSKELDSIRIPNHIRLMIPEFFSLDDVESEEINGSLYKVKKIDLKITDAKDNVEYEDKEAKITYKPGQSYLTFVSEKLNDINYEENDIIRIIKVQDNEYQIEIINKKMQEYKVWSKLCNQTFRASTKKFGMM